jgi:hypothetical protein
MYVEKLTMKDFRCFEQAEVSFVYPGKKGLPEEAIPNVTLLIGINGTGKTSVLKGVALAQLCPIISASGLFPRHFVRVAQPDTVRDAVVVTQFPSGDHTEWPGAKHKTIDQAVDPGGALKVARIGDTELYADYYWSTRNFFAIGHATEDKEVNDHVLRRELLESLYSDRSSDYLLLGYGALRRADSQENPDTQRSRNRHLKYQRVAGLFEDAFPLYPLAAWFLRPETDPHRKEVRGLLNKLLPNGTEFTGEFKDADALFKHNGVKLPFGALSDGFRSYIGLVADMLYHLNYVCPKKSKLTDLSGVVMIDDIDVHLHPKWQREVVPKLAGTFPKLQFIITSHSPLVAGTLHAANIRVIEDNQIHEYTERIHGLSADQILTSSYFMLDTSRSPAAVDKLHKIEKRIVDQGDPAAAIEYLRELAGDAKPNGGKKNGAKKKK